MEDAYPRKLSAAKDSVVSLPVSCAVGLVVGVEIGAGGVGAVSKAGSAALINNGFYI